MGSPRQHSSFKHPRFIEKAVMRYASPLELPQVKHRSRFTQMLASDSIATRSNSGGRSRIRNRRYELCVNLFCQRDLMRR
jgi:hypothetical protein